MYDYAEPVTLAERWQATPSISRLRIAAMGDLHFDGSLEAADELRDVLAIARDEAEVLVLAGDLTSRGLPEEMTSLIRVLESFRGPVIAVLGNHDHESDCAPLLERFLRHAGVHVLAGTHVVVGSVGFAGTKGFGGGFAPHVVSGFGERTLRQFRDATTREADALERALSSLTTPTRIVVTHYAPVPDTLAGEPVELWPVLGSSALMDVIDRWGATAAFHGHAHRGSPEGRTRAGIPVYNVARPVLERSMRLPFRIYSVPAMPPAPPAEAEERRCAQR